MFSLIQEELSPETAPDSVLDSPLESPKDDSQEADAVSEVRVPPSPSMSFRLTIELTSSRPRMDQVVLEELRKQKRSLALRIISRTQLKELFKKKKIRIKGQIATPSSSLARGITYVDILGFEEDVKPSET